MAVTDTLRELREQVEQNLSEMKDTAALDALRVKVLGKKGTLTELLKGMGKLSPEERPVVGQKVNALRSEIEDWIDERSRELAAREEEERLKKETLDISIPGDPVPMGCEHPLSSTLERIIDIFVGMGFSVAEGPEVEQDKYNFELLNLPKNHPARDAQDTFYFNENLLLRTHTSPVQARTMLSQKPPIRVICPGRVFRNEGVDTRHNPEFTLMELYQAYTDYHGMMDLTENMFRYLAQEVCGSTVITYGENEIDLGKPFERLTMINAVKRYAGVDFDAVPDTEAAKKLADERGIAYEARHQKGDILNMFFEEYCEDKLIQPTFIMDHPVDVSPLTKRKPDKPDYVERFELFVNGWEMCNAYSELNDPIDQRQRFEKQVEQRERGDDETEMLDEDFLTAMEYGMPPTGGMGMGIDRCVMLLTGADTIREVILFPTMKPIEN